MSPKFLNMNQDIKYTNCKANLCLLGHEIFYSCLKVAGSSLSRDGSFQFLL
jgi:hypothetical protein